MGTIRNKGLYYKGTIRVLEYNTSINFVDLFLKGAIMKKSLHFSPLAT